MLVKLKSTFAGGGTALGAAMLGIVGGVCWALAAGSAAEGAAMYGAANTSPSSIDTVRELRQATYMCGGLAVAYLAGAILLFARTRLGRAVLIVSSVVGIVHISVTAIGEYYLMALAVYGVPSLLAVFLAAMRSTGRWIAAQPSGHSRERMIRR
ncbi:hypothetical protein [Nocardia otitidiscaviarum]|uniref:hypothetical protein n=1 Tax=Nocardia otitidiscaviarum TaxID=1823 RepID=UPI001894EE33|nr:hypothetical protein [Nocardia otitidiscaviarum]MBF6182320.1 hypothetical protein [Nocardia otitidiscaviarum]